MLNWDRNMQTIGRSFQRSAFLLALGLAWLPSAHAAPEGAAIKPGVVPAGIDKSAIPGRAIPSVKPEESDDDGGDATDAAEEESSTTESSATTFSPPRQKPPILDPNAKIMLDFVNKPIMDLIKYMAEITGRNFILTDDIKGEVTIISHKAVTVP
ncbi:MAG: hypothetical protein VX127_17025, partial [Myxococcota bacterium]|nr:hypothetical protein [Myxococcota bacterium]